jgi:nitrogen-specific signal transduction histidine kinase/CheY-like chemotaxis protein
VFTLEYTCPTPTELRWFQVRFTRFQGPGALCLVASHLDITTLKLAEEQRAQLERLLNRSQKMESLGGLAGGVAHEMNNVLGTILGMASVHEDLNPVGSPTHKAFSVIAKACHRGASLVRRLLDFARQDLAEIRLLNLNTLIREEVQLLERTSFGQVAFSAELDPDLQAIRGDAGALVHAILNLCLNAVDAMPGGGRLSIRTRNAGPEWVELEVQDSGEGMPKDVLEKAVDPFFTTKPTGKGTGLGLSIVYGTVKAHQGTLELRSETGRGTTAILRFPSAGAFESEGERQAETPSERAQQPLEILLVDDDDLIRTTLVSVIESLGHRVIPARSGEEALDWLDRDCLPQIVILDMNMPGLGGEGTLPRLRERQPGLPVLLATGRADQAALDLAQAFPGVTLLPKPFSKADLRRHLETLVRTDSGS